MKNNQMRQRLGLSHLRSMMASILSGRMNDAPPQESGSLYDGDDIVGSDDEMVSNVTFIFSSNDLSLPFLPQSIIQYIVLYLCRNP
jgi:hypothetical protein